MLGLPLHALSLLSSPPHAGHSLSLARSVTAKRMAAVDSTEYDYVVVGAGASGMAFTDTLLLHSPAPVSVLLLDKRAQPGGHWSSAYSFVTLHQPARNYGVESRALEATVSHPELLASREEILEYYRAVLDGWIADGHTVCFVGDAAYDFGARAYKTGSGALVPVAAATVVDARYTENDIPVHVPPRFAIGDGIDLISPNELPSRAPAAAEDHFVVLGAGKTGQDAMLYLREVLQVPRERLMWVMPNDPWITARDPPAPLRQNTCIEFIASALDAHDAAGSPSADVLSSAFLQRGFERLEEEGKVYRIDASVRPAKFMDATLNRYEVGVLRECAPCIVRGKGRVSAVAPSGSLSFEGGATVELPWAGEGKAKTCFVHCTAGAFNFGGSAMEAKRPVFAEGRITLQEIFQFPGFCFNGAVIGWVECQPHMTAAEKSALCETPGGEAGAPPPLGPVAGGVGALDAAHPLLVSLRNLRRWYATAGMGEWLHSLRLFSLTMNSYSLAEGKALAEKNHEALVAAGVIAR